MKKIIMRHFLLGVISFGVAEPVSANELVVDGTKNENSATVVTRGNLGEIDPTDPEMPLPETDDRWIKVTLPTAVVFESSDVQKEITSRNDYEITNKSGRPVKVDVIEYEISGGDGVKVLTELNISRSKGYGDNKLVNLVSSVEGSKVGKYDINKEFVRLANNEGKYEDREGKDFSTTFEFTGKMNKENLVNKKNYIDSNLTFKFSTLPL